MILPRPDLALLGIKYRRIPVLAINGEVYCDSRLILQKLEEVFPGGTLRSVSQEQETIRILLSNWIIDGGIFNRAMQLLPTSLPAMKDEKFQKDRAQYTGRVWQLDRIERARPEALSEIRLGFDFLENVMFQDGRKWILNTDGPSLADIEGKRA